MWWEMQAVENEQRETVKGVSRTQLSCAIVLTSLTDQSCFPCGSDGAQPNVVQKLTQNESLCAEQEEPAWLLE